MQQRQSEMRIFACLVFIALAHATQGAPSPQVIDNQDIPIGKFKYQVSLRNNDKHICSGSILNNFNVLTSASCIAELKCSLNETKVHVGTNFLNESGYVYDIESISVHQNYDSYLLINDIALLHLDTPMRYNVLVQPITLSKSDKNFENKPCTLSGWGFETNGNISNSLQEIDLIGYKQTECAKKHWQLTSSHICTSPQNKTICQNDFGGPLVISGAQLGIASFGNLCEPENPTVYTKVTSFLPWINANLKITIRNFNMYTFFVLIVALQLAIAIHGVPSNHIVGGKDAPVGKFPYQISLRIFERHSCGGSIINRHTILTAAHCIRGYGSDPKALESLTVHAGTNLLNENGTVYKVKQAISHEDFDSFKLVNDIGLLILSTSIEYTKYIQPISLAITDIAPSGSSCILSGWGQTMMDGSVPNKLQEIELIIFDYYKCKQTYWGPQKIQPSHICTFTTLGEGACKGDSGGPLVFNGVQIGIVSFGVPCALGRPDVFTRVSSFKEWIQKYIVE
ncbi:PREDICTED: transmembrane protease serine 3-like [Cyphomyrmex costatus]|uniref:transmembrane protease serine 3-like n=1 Tax=Cyphomyrmex costatus TaxID=456900 RepID=UPI0008523D61|nr:PREDICTED: transmembrane protease serine 3-like [Cyphomyrmex costatus]